MAEGFLRSFDPDLEVYSAGTEPSERVHPMAVAVMAEKGVDLTRHWPKKVDRYLEDSFDYVITVCDQANESCPVFLGDVKNRLHMGFDDPAKATGTEEEIMAVFRRVRDEIADRMYAFFKGL